MYLKIKKLIKNVNFECLDFSKSLEIVEDFSIYLNTDLNDDLLMERLSREIVSAIQKERKNKNLNVSDRIRLNFQTKDVFAKETIKKFSNYINNAIKHSPKKSSVVIDCEKVDKDFCRIMVKDNGSGIAKKYRERVFERFFRVDKGRSKKIGGTGLGLSISKNLALMMGYSVGVDTNTPKGSIFYIDVKTDHEASKEVA